MRSSLSRLRGLGFHRSEPKEKRNCRPPPPAKLDELVQAAQDMHDMRSCYDGLLSAAAATANSAYEFSEALHEMGTCLLEKTALHDDEDNGRVSLMLGKAQFELQRLVDNYRAHIIQTITTPSECLLRELHIVEDMKHQCDAKRDLYKFMLTAPRRKGRSKNAERETFTPKQLQAAREDYEEEANLFFFRLKSLKQGQSRSLLTQAARHHAAQLNFFRKGLKSLELIEPHVKSIAKQQHIDYHFSELEDDDTDNDSDGSFNCNSSDGEELSFDYGLQEQTGDALSMRQNSMELDQVDNTTTQPSSLEFLQENVTRMQAELLYRYQRPSLGSQSAPIFAERNFIFPGKIKEMPPPLTRKSHTYVLPTPVDVKNSTSTGTNISFSASQLETKGGSPTQMWHSSPLEPHKLTELGDKNFPSPTRSPEAQTRSEGGTIKSSPINTPAPSSDAVSHIKFTSFSTSDAKKIRRHAFSGPLTGKSWSSRPYFASYGIPKVQEPYVHSKLTHTSSIRKFNDSSPLTSSPRISELHELPRPPSSSSQAVVPSSLVGHSAPLVPRGQDMMQITGKSLPVSSPTASPLSAPLAVHRSFSIPYRGQRTPLGSLNKLLEAPLVVGQTEEVDSPPLTPLSLRVFNVESPSSLISSKGDW